MPNFRIFIFFFLSTIAGTLLHEMGHVIAGICMGFDVHIHYASTSFIDPDSIFEAAERNSDFEEVRFRSMISTAGGPLQTILTGTVGIIGLWTISRKETIDAYKLKHLLWIVLAYFWSREIVVVAGIIYKLYFLHTASSRSDEYKLFRHAPGSAVYYYVVLLAIACGLLSWVTFGLVKKHRLQLIVFGAIGCAVAYPLWMCWLGPLVLP